MASFSLRSFFLVLALLGGFQLSLISEVSAQNRQQRDQDRGQQEGEEETKKDDEWTERQLNLKVRRSGKCGQMDG
jgi:hypothetical protein